MKHIKIFFCLLVISFLTVSCSNDASTDTDDTYAFFVAGHTYGNTSNKNPGLHPPFKKEFDSIRAYPHMAFGVLVGDIVLRGDKESWDAVDREIAELGIPLYLVPGNHDVYDDYELFKHRYGDREHEYASYRSIRNNEDLMILLDGNLDDWNITGDQLAFLEEALTVNREQVNHVFIFVHQLIWWDEHTVFKNIVHNWPPYTPDTTNYWGTLEPMFQDYPAPVFLFAGDLGIFERTTPYMYYKENNVTYVATGMGSEVNDNYLFVTVRPDGEVDFDLIALQGDRRRFGNLEDYVLP